ncbi:MAG: YkgJ family cysteine cluster protein [Candidatus Gastranaerophilaceae bacterium]
MSDLSTDIDNLKKKYREIFLKTSEEFNRRLEKIKPEELLTFLNEDVSKEIYEKWMKVLEYRKKFRCKGCAACCNLACSEFSPEELAQKAKEGDNFAAQFTSIFVPYKDESEAQKIYPEYFELLKTNVQDEKVYFYHCPKVTRDNRCPDYENRPQICRNFPDNPIGFLPKTCGYKCWKEEVEPTALMLRSMLEIVEFYKAKVI